MKKILVTGGAGYIGSHTAVALAEAGYLPVIIDNFSNSERKTIDRIAGITGSNPVVYEGDCTDAEFLKQVLKKEEDISGVIHFAAYKAVSESVSQPLRYYKNNLGGLITLLEVMDLFGNVPLIFSSSASVYGNAAIVPTPEDAEIKQAVSPYGSTKIIGEMILQDKSRSETPLAAIALRYFNPIGAHPGGMLGEAPGAEAANILPLILKVAAGEKAQLTIYGNDYPTPDGTCIRDFIHVMDLAEAHVATLKYLLTLSTPHYDVLNVGTGKGSSVLELLRAFKDANGINIPYVIGPRREGDTAVSCADVTKIHSLLGWSSTRSIESAMKDAWKWHIGKN